MRKVITYGTFDLLHHGHIALLQKARQLGDYLIVGVTSDAFDKARGKLNVQQPLVKRIEGIKATGLADEIIIEEYEGQKIADIKKYGVDIFTIGSDWEGKFDYLKEFCEVVYLPRTKDISSTELRASQNPKVKIGLIGLENPVERFLAESKFVTGVSIAAAYSDNQANSQFICDKYHLKSCESMDELLSTVDAVYIATTIDKHFEYIMQALAANCHVLCESPLFLSKAAAETALALAQTKKLVLLEAVKTLFFPAFEHLLLMVGSGVIGSIKDIDVSFSQLANGNLMNQPDIYRGSMYDLGSYVLLPIVKILGTQYTEQEMFCYRNDLFSVFTKGILRYPHATASFKAGKGIKTEGNLIITGTKGYIYVPAPWWKIEYFEIRYEDLRNTKKYFYKYEGEGLRYELLEFVMLINSGAVASDKYSQEEMMVATRIIEEFDKGKVKCI
jgi:choline-phosphate cytidylyltransferase